MASPAADWPLCLRVAEVERGVNASPARYMYGCAALRDQGETLKRGEKQTATTTSTEPWTLYTLSIYRSTEQERTQADSIQFITVAAERTWKVWRNAVSVPAPDQPAVCLQQPAG